MSDKDLHKFNGIQPQSGDKPDNSLPYPASRMAPAIELVDMAREIASANTSVQQHTSSKLKLIARQIQALQEEAHRILSSAQQDISLHQAECNFKKQPGRIYHLYQRPDGRQYFSMLSPAEWHQRPPHPYVGSYRLEADMSWSPLETLSEEDSNRKMIEELLEGKGLL